MDDIRSSTKLPTVKETVLKRRRRTLVADEQSRSKNQRRALEEKRLKGKSNFKSLSKNLKERRDHVLNAKRSRAAVLKPESCRVEVTNKAAFVIRLRSTKDVPEYIEKILRLFRLKSINDGVFVKLNRAARDLLAILDKHVTWGYPNLKSIRNILSKRGKQKGKAGLTDNAVIENALGNHDIVCLDDIVHEIWSCGEKMKMVCSFLHNFQLGNPPGGWQNVSKNFKHKGDSGFRGDEINQLLITMV